MFGAILAAKEEAQAPMLRTLASMGLTFGAIAWAVFASSFVFFYGSTFFIGALGRFGAFWGALLAFVVALVIARTMLRLADKLIEPLQGPFDARAYEGAPPETYFRDWARYAADMVRSRRYAFYRRTRQFEKLAALEKEIAAARAARPAELPEPPHPRRTTMAGRVTWEENRRGARRMSAEAPKRQRWAALDEDEGVLPPESTPSPATDDPARRGLRSAARADRLS